jgi:hypothetical protein
MIDVAFARQLQHNRHLLWASEGTHPDLGGAEADEHFLWSDPLKEPVVNHPGAYRTICVELDVSYTIMYYSNSTCLPICLLQIYGLAICAIQNSVSLDGEGLTAVTVSSDTNSGNAFAEEGSGSKGQTNTFSTDASCARAFALLKAVVTKWLDDVKLRGDAISDSILTALYRYLCGFGDALLRDPLLHRIVYLLMTKLFKRLLVQLRELQVTVVHANFSRILVDTKKYDIAGAVEYIEFIIGTITSKELFSLMEISPKAYWEQLLWLGPENWGGLVVPENEEAHLTNSAEFSDEEEINVVNPVTSCDDVVAVIEVDARGAPVATQNGPGQSSTKAKPGPVTNASHSEYDFLDHLLSPEKKISGRARYSRDLAEGLDAQDQDELLDEGAADVVDSYDNGDEEDGNVRTVPLNGDRARASDPKSLVRHNWNLAAHLPEAVANYFYELIGIFLLFRCPTSILMRFVVYRRVSIKIPSAPPAALYPARFYTDRSHTL